MIVERNRTHGSGGAALTSWVAPALSLLIALTLGQASPAYSSPFSALEGVWSGSGKVRFDDGRSERVRCRAYYNAKNAGSQMALAIRCASTSYKIELRSALNLSGTNVHGTWEERTFNANGTLKGTAEDSAVKLEFAGGFMGSLAVSFGGSQQRVSISTGKQQTSNPVSIYLNLSRRD